MQQFAPESKRMYRFLSRAVVVTDIDIGTYTAECPVLSIILTSDSISSVKMSSLGMIEVGWQISV